ncbi:MAG: 3'-5' exonuclease [Desulfopila sp.]
MINRTENEERAYLEAIKEKLGGALAILDGRVRQYAQNVRDQKNYLWEHRADMDHVEKISARESAHQAVLSGEAVMAGKNRLQRLLQTPYFGRFDFIGEGEKTPLPVYVGLHAFRDETEKKNRIFDWRAPISTMFYDYELGAAQYTSPSGDIQGEISVKRQFRIRRGEMEFMLESGLNILDDVLQEELSRASDDRMKNIVATIQRDQNAIIRNEDAEVLIIQGVAGSGKTSIALHRIAFLLYRFKENLTAESILIVSPNKVFADFISNVLPELGEEQIGEIEMETLARELLEGKYTFQTSYEQSSLLLETADEELKNRIRVKSSLDFLKQLDRYVDHVESTRFQAENLEVDAYLYSAEFIEQTYAKRLGLPVSERLRWVAEVIEHDLWLKKGYEITARERAAMKTTLKKMYRHATVRTLYKEFFTWTGRPELFKPLRGSRLEYGDVFPLIYLKIRLEGTGSSYKGIRHLLIDEMQDYSPVQYAVIAKLFTCEKTILGDVNQSVNPFSSSTSEVIRGVFRQAECVKLCKSYRSSFEITEFAQGISPDADLVAIERHGNEPAVLMCESRKEEISRLWQSIEDFKAAAYQTMGIICKTQKQAEQIFKAIGDAKTTLLSPQSTSFRQGVVICTAHLAKGLEFDQVHIPGADENNYADVMDKNLLYVACTRAMHALTLTYVGAPTRFIRNQKKAINVPEALQQL